MPSSAQELVRFIARLARKQLFVPHCRTANPQCPALAEYPPSLTLKDALPVLYHLARAYVGRSVHPRFRQVTFVTFVPFVFIVNFVFTVNFVNSSIHRFPVEMLVEKCPAAISACQKLWPLKLKNENCRSKQQSTALFRPNFYMIVVLLSNI